MKRYLLHIIGLATLLTLLGGCSRSEAVPENDGADDVMVNLSISTRAALSQEGRETGTGLPDNMHLWIYGASADGTLTDLPLAYVYKDQGIFIGSDIYGNPVESIKDLLIKNAKQYDKLHFHLVLNSGDMEDVDGDMTVEGLQELTFTPPVTVGEENKMLMYGSTILDVNPSKSHYDDIEIKAERTMAKLEMYFTRRYEESELSIDNITLQSGLNYGYLVPTELADDDYTDAKPVDLLSAAVAIETVSSEKYGDFSKDEVCFTRLASSYLLENPAGVAQWNGVAGSDGIYPENGTAGTEKYYQVTVEYTIDGMKKTPVFYLPPIERNHFYKIYARIAPGDKPMLLDIEVKEWNDGGNGQIDKWE